MATLNAVSKRAKRRRGPLRMQLSGSILTRRKRGGREGGRKEGRREGEREGLYLLKGQSGSGKFNRWLTKNRNTKRLRQKDYHKLRPAWATYGVSRQLGLQGDPASKKSKQNKNHGSALSSGNSMLVRQKHRAPIPHRSVYTTARVSELPEKSSIRRLLPFLPSDH